MADEDLETALQLSHFFWFVGMDDGSSLFRMGVIETKKTCLRRSSRPDRTE